MARLDAKYGPLEKPEQSVMSAVLPDGSATLTHADLMTVLSALADATVYRSRPRRRR